MPGTSQNRKDFNANFLHRKMKVATFKCESM